MQKFSTIILYQAYGLIEIYHQVLFSILTLYHHLNGNFEGIQIVVYTDNPNFFKKQISSLPIIIELLTEEVILTYKGRNNFVHRVKICIIQDCFKKYNTDIFYLDSDTYFTNSPKRLINKINSQTSIMNSDDYDLVSADELYENLDWLQIRKAILNYKYIIDNEIVYIPLTTRMWNAGVIGISVQNATLLDQVLDLTDQIYANKKVFTAEQFAFSYFLQNKTHLISSEDVIFHYWPNFKYMEWKQTYNYHFKVFFLKNKNLSIDQQALLAYKLTQQHNIIVQPKKLTIVNRIIYRFKLVIAVALKGKLD